MAGLFDDLMPAQPAGPTTQPSLDPRARDLAIRTVLGEAANEPDEGMAGVAAVIRNRVQAGRYGGEDIPRVVTARNQFEPWNTEDGRKRMFSYAPDSPAYQRAAAAVDRVFGEGFDPTNGATHFFSPTAQAALGRNVPAWAQGEGQPIGRHTFYAPEGRVTAQRPTDLSSQSRRPTGLFDDLLPAAPQATSPTSPPAEALADTGGRFSDNPGQNFRTAREGESPKVATRGEAVAEGALRGATFNFIDEISALAKAGGLDASKNDTGGQALVRMVQGLYQRVMGDPDAEAIYRAELSKAREKGERIQEQQPGASLAGEVGGVVATLPLTAGRAVAGAGLGARTLQGAQAGAVTGGLAGVGAGTDLESRATGGATGAAVGGTVGAVAPAAIEGVVRGARGIATPIANAVRGVRDPESEAARRVTLGLQRDIQADPQAAARLTPQEFAASVQGGGPATLMDLGGETTRALARSAANTSPEGRQILNQAINDRFEGQTGRVTGWLNNTFNFPNAAAQQEAIEQTARTVNRGAYARAYNDRAAQSLWDNNLEQIAQAPVVQDAIRAATRTGGNQAAIQGFTPVRNPFRFDEQSQRMVLADPNVRPNLQFWDHVKRNLDDTVTRLQRGGENSAARDAIQLRTALLNQLDTQVPAFANARAGAAHFFGAENALEAGQNYVTQNFATPEVRRSLARMTPTERQLFQDGFVSRYIETLDRIGDRRSVLNQIAASPAAREKLNVALGPQRAQELEAGLRTEGVMDFARTAVQGNSTTARQLTELGLAGGTYGLGTGFDVMNPNPSALMSAALVYGAARGRTRINENVSRRVAEMLTSNDPRQLARGVQIVARNQNMLNSLRAFDQSLARVSAQQAPTPAVPAIQSMGIGRAEENQPRVPGP
jgi:hypothetical protein